MPNKPTGRIGPFQVTVGREGPAGNWEKIQFPKQKEEIEQLILDLFVTEMRKKGATILGYKQNPQNDFDFTLELPGGRISLDLTEVIYRDEKGRPYEGEEIRIESYQYATQIHDAVMAKSIHYGKAVSQPIHLLAYITHWRFQPNELVIRLVQHMLQHSKPIIENVFLLLPLDNKSADLRVLYPSTAPLEGQDVSSVKDNFYLNLNPGKWEILGSS